MELETLALAMKQNKMKMGDHYLAFDKRLGELEEEVFLPRATTLSRVLAWGEHFQEVLGKLKKDSSIYHSIFKKRLGTLIGDVIGICFA